MKKLTILLTMLFISCSATPEKIKKSPQYDMESRKFKNKYVEEKSFGKVIKWLWSRDAKKWPEHVDNKRSDDTNVAINENEFALSFINHSTFLIQINGLNILTDPVYSLRTSPVQWAGPKRVREPGVPFKKLPKIDVVIISHNHYDHMDLDTLKKLEKKFSPLVLAPLGDKKLLEGIGLKNVKELDWWEEIKVNEHKFTYVPSQHFSGRGLFDRMKSLWGGYVLETKGKRLYFAGDTGYSKHFSEIYEKLGAMDFSLIPIGAYAPRWFMKDMHVNPDDAVKAHLDLKSNYSIGMHYGTFQLTDEKIDQPLIDLEIAKKKYQVENFSTLLEGETKVYKY
tara:strand:- start:118405 stop:119418 length:1014 start_codon:yes stop_codon:yes gene_type:complete